MFAIAFDMSISQTAPHHPSGSPTRAYADIRRALQTHGFEWRQGSMYTLDDEDMVRLVAAINALQSLPWFLSSVRDIRAFRVEQWSDFTTYVRA